MNKQGAAGGSGGRGHLRRPIRHLGDAERTHLVHLGTVRRAVGSAEHSNREGGCSSCATHSLASCSIEEESDPTMIKAQELQSVHPLPAGLALFRLCRGL